MPARVLVVSHEAKRTGAPKVAIEIQRSLHGAEGTEVVSLVRGGGPLIGDFEATSDRLRREPLARARAVLRRFRWLRGSVNRFDELIAWSVLKRSRPTIAYLNTVKSACYVRPALRLGIPTILHVHEVGTLASSTLRRYPVGDRWKEVRLVACSTAARDELAELVHVPVDDIDVIHSPVDTTDVERRAQPAGPPGNHQDPSPRLVVACGSVNDRKGADLWVQVAKAVRGGRPDLAVRFLWVGHRPSGWPTDLAKELGVDSSIDWIGEVAEPDPLIAAADVFTLPSREDPFPLVVLEAMALARPIVAFDVGGVREQLGDAGIVVPAEDVAAMAGAVAALLDDESERRRLGAAAADRVRSLYDIGPFREQIKRIVREVGGVGGRHLAVLKSPDYERFRQQRDDGGLPYRIDHLRRFGYIPSFSDIRYRPPWNASWVRPALDRLEARGVPTLQTLAMAPRIARSDAVLAMFESEGHFLALARTLRLPIARRPPMVVISCWLASVLPTVAPARLAWYRRMYRTVDRIVVFSTNQVEPLARLLDIDDHVVRYVPFGIDSDWFAPRSVGVDGGFILAVGRDRGRDWPTLFTAAGATGLPTKIACRPSDIAGLAVPDNVEVLGYVDVDSYRSLLRRARVSVVATYDVPYPSGQTVALESMAAAKATVVTRTASLSDYLDDGVNALTVPVGDAQALANAITEAFEDGALRHRLGSGARAAVERAFNARAMWSAVATILDEVSSPASGTAGDRVSSRWPRSRG